MAVPNDSPPSSLARFVFFFSGRQDLSEYEWTYKWNIDDIYRMLSLFAGRCWSNGHWCEYKDKKGNYIAPAVTFGGCQNRRKSNKCESQYEFLVTVEPCLQSCRYACATVIGNFSPNIFTGLNIFSHFGNSHCRSHRRRRRLRIITAVCNSRCYPILFLTLVVEGCPPRIIACIRFNVLHLSLRIQTPMFLNLVVGGCQPRIIIACIRFNVLHLSLRI